MAQLDVLFDGYGGDGVASTVSLIRDENLVAVVDPGMVPSRSVILDPLESLGVEVGDVTDVIISHHHPDHTINIALFPDATVHDHWATYHNDVWMARSAEGVRLSPGVCLLETPGHTPQDITTLVDTEAGVAALTHLWVYEGAGEDRLATDPAALEVNRDRVLGLATLIVPGHGPMYRIDRAR
jgi:glyoxylase-like metal-dependent hydrolase (beta-lactamase superfamily II)